jgi:transcriptional regulator with XRE-family HTH domain
VSFFVMVKGDPIASAVLQPMQCRMARVALGWSLDEAAAATGISRRAVLRFERGESAPRGRTLQTLRRAYEAAGVRFIDGGPDAGGVIPPPVQVLSS